LAEIAKDNVHDILKRISLFEGIKDDQQRLDSVAGVLKSKRVNAGEIIIEEGDLGDSLYIIKDGSVRILKNTLEDEMYTVIILKANENVFFGELALIDKDQRSASVMAESDCELLVLSRDKFARLAEKDPYFGFKVMQTMAKIISTRLRKANKDIITLFEALVHEVEGADEIGMLEV
jgi:CRP-like cAMP-binding protein